MERHSPEASTSPGSTPKPSFLARLHFIWFVVVGVLWTIVMAIVQFATHCIYPTAHNFKRNGRIWGGVILFLSGIRVHVTDGARIDRDIPVVFLCNHQCMLDILALSAALPYPFGFVAKQELAPVPFLGFAIRYSASVFIDRRDPRAAVTSLKQAGERIRRGNSVLVFVEGTRSHGPDLQPFKKGAFAIAVEAGVPAVPVTLVDGYRRMDERKRLLSPGAMHMVIGPPMHVEGKTRRNIPELMEQARIRLVAPLVDAQAPSG